MSSALASEIGEELEYLTITGDDGLEHVGDGEADWYDARLQDGTPVEVKACAERISSGTSTRRGRILIKREAHDRLLEANGRYRVVVYDQDRAILVEADVSAADVDEVISSWIDAPPSRSYDAYAQVRWPLLVDVAALQEGSA